jgi:uncharacterized protein
MLHLELLVELPGQFICDRCGQPFERLHSGSDDFYFTFAGTAQAGKDPEIPVVARHAAEIDVSQEIRDLVVLSLPYQTICSPGCKGLCQRCGANLNVESCRCNGSDTDPRWEALQSLRGK